LLFATLMVLLVGTAMAGFDCCSGELTFGDKDVEKDYNKRTVNFSVKFLSTPVLSYGISKVEGKREMSWVYHNKLTAKKVDFEANDSYGAIRLRWIACGKTA